MGFGGSTSGANVSLKNNRRERKSKMDKYQKTTGSNIAGIKEEKQFTAAEREEWRTKISSANQKRQRKILLITALLLFILIAVSVYFLFIF